MRGNSPPYCPVCYTQLKTLMHPFSGHSFLNCYAGDFNGDGKDDLLVHNGNSIMLFRSNGSQLDLVFSAVERVPGSWQFQPGDRFFIGDFNNDGKDEVVVYNSTELGHGVPGTARRRRQQRPEADRALRRCDAGLAVSV